MASQPRESLSSSDLSAPDTPGPSGHLHRCCDSPPQGSTPLSMWIGYEPSAHSCSVRSWKVVSVTGSSPRSRADLLILARTVKPSACLSVTICSACAWTAETGDGVAAMLE